jgi:hypothetical protein
MRARKASTVENDSRPSDHCFTIQGTGELLTNGTALELIRDAKTNQTRLLVSQGSTRRVADVFEYDGRVYRPPSMSSSVEQAVPLPSQCSSYKSTRALFGETRSLLATQGFSDEVSLISTHFVFAAWFRNGALPAPCLTITGPPAEALLLLQLLGCLVPRGLPVMELSSNGFLAITDQLHPTWLIDARFLSGHSRRLLSASCTPRAKVVWKDSVVDFGLAKAIYVGAVTVPEFSLDFSLHVHVAPSTDCLGALDDQFREQIIAEFQPKFLGYRIRNLSAVRASRFDIPEMKSETRVIARILGASIVDAPEIQAGIRPMLRAREEQIRERWFTDQTSVVIDVLLAYCHGHKLYAVGVKEIAQAAAVALKARGEPVKLEPRRVGAILDTLGLPRKRSSRGFRVRLEAEAQRRIHLLARDYQIESIRERKAACALCTEMFGVSGLTEHTYTRESAVNS